MVICAVRQVPVEIAASRVELLLHIWKSKKTVDIPSLYDLKQFSENDQLENQIAELRKLKLIRWEVNNLLPGSQTLFQIVPFEKDEFLFGLKYRTTYDISQLVKEGLSEKAEICRFDADVDNDKSAIFPVNPTFIKYLRAFGSCFLEHGNETQIFHLIHKGLILESERTSIRSYIELACEMGFIARDDRKYRFQIDCQVLLRKGRCKEEFPKGYKSGETHWLSELVWNKSVSKEIQTKYKPKSGLVASISTIFWGYISGY
ncbi:MAG: hypothetical protein Q7R53_00005 [bacterium]|nr:hypothetical protein [bacterium]